MVQELELRRRNGEVVRARISDEDVEWVCAYRWSVGTRNYIIRKERRADKKNQSTVLLHRAILEHMGVDLTGKNVDHIDRDPTNNTRENLRAGTQSQNCANQGKSVGKSSRYKGVSWDKTYQRWSSQIRLDGKLAQLGRFDSEHEAALVYNVAALKQWGEFALVNAVPEEWDAQERVSVQRLRNHNADLDKALTAANRELAKAQQEIKRLQQFVDFLKAANTRVTQAYNELYDQQVADKAA